jgi:hypothetical protein
LKTQFRAKGDQKKILLTTSEGRFGQWPRQKHFKASAKILKIEMINVEKLKIFLFIAQRRSIKII